MARHTAHAAQREAQAAASQAEQYRVELAASTKIEKEKAERDKLKAQRILMRSIRAGGGGFFETDQGTGSTLGGSGVLG